MNRKQCIRILTLRNKIVDAFIKNAPNYKPNAGRRKYDKDVREAIDFAIKELKEQVIKGVTK